METNNHKLKSSRPRKQCIKSLKCDFKDQNSYGLKNNDKSETKLVKEVFLVAKISFFLQNIHSFILSEVLKKSIFWITTMITEWMYHQKHNSSESKQDLLQERIHYNRDCQLSNGTRNSSNFNKFEDHRIRLNLQLNQDLISELYFRRCIQ